MLEDLRGLSRLRLGAPWGPFRYPYAADGFELPWIGGFGRSFKWEFHSAHQFSQGLGPSYKTYFTDFSTGLEVLVKVG